MIVTQPNSYTGTTTISEGTIRLTGSGTLGTGTVNIAQGAVLDIGAANQSLNLLNKQVLKGTIKGTGNLEITSLGDFWVNIDLGTTGEVTLNDSTAFRGNYQVKQLTTGPAGKTFWLYSNTVFNGDIVNQTGIANTFYFARNEGTETPVVVNGDITGKYNFVFSNSATDKEVKINGNVSANSINTNAGNLKITGNTTTTGNITTGTGVLTMNGNVSAPNITATGGTLSITGSVTTTGVTDVTNGVLSLVATGDSTIKADSYKKALQIGFAASEYSDTTAVMTISGDKTVHVTNGASTTNGSVNIGIRSTGTLNVNSGTLKVDGRILLGSNEVRANGTLNITGGEVILGVEGSYTTGGDPGCGALWVNTGTATVNLDGGTLAFYGMRDADSTATAAGSAFNFNGGTLKAVATNNTNFLTPQIPYNVKAGGAIIDTNNFDLTIAPVLNGSEGDGGLTKMGLGTLNLTGANTYNGDTVVQAGTLKITGSGALGNGYVCVKDGATLDVSEKTSALDLKIRDDSAGTISGNGGAMIIEVPTEETKTFSSTVSGVSGITFNGSGTLKMDYDSESPLTVPTMESTAGNLYLKGDYVTDLTVSGGVFSPGNSIGTTYLTGDFALEDGATLLLETGTEDGIYNADRLRITEGGAVFGTTSDITLSEWDGTYPLSDTSFTLLSATDGITGIEGVNWSGILESAHYDLDRWTLGGNANAITLSYAEDHPNVPEPSAWILMILGLSCVGWMRRKRS